jgi:hypothetical protein
MYSTKIDSQKAMKMLNNVVKYSQGFIDETSAKQQYVASKLASSSIEAFYDYLDVLARTNPGMLHHVYEWGQVGDPQGRLVQLKKILAGNNANISAEFLQSSSIPDGGNEPFYNKAEIMEEGITVTIDEVDAKALFFEVNGEEFFRTGPIVIENPGGESVRGSFLRAFEEFYNVYFDQMYLRAIRFYDHFRSAPGYAKNFAQAINSNNAYAVGRKTALSWVLNAPGDDYE